MRGSTFKRCGCRDEAGRQLGKACPDLSKTGHGRWYYRIDTGRDPKTGKRSEERLTKPEWRSKSDAEDALALRMAEVVTGEFRHDGRETVATFLTGWLERKVQDGLRPSSERMYRTYVTHYLVPAIGTVRLSDLRPGHVDKLLRDLRSQGKGATTIRRVHAVLSSALGSAKRARLIAYNPAADVDLPRISKAKVEPWEPEELGRFLDSAGTHRLGALFELMAFTGLRRGEALALRWADVDLVAARLTIRTQLVQVGSRVVEGVTKTPSGEQRVVDLGDRTVGVLMAQQIAQDAERSSWGSGYVDNDRVFAREDGSDLSPEYVTKTFGRLLKAAGLRKQRLHDLRHLSASLMIAGGVDIAVVSKRLGHSQISVTADLYSHLIARVGRQAADAAEGLVPARRRPGHRARPHCAHMASETTKRLPPEGESRWSDDGAPSGTRTPNPLIKSQLLCQLS